MAENGRRRGADLLAERLAAGDTIAGAAKAARISERTAYRRIAGRASQEHPGDFLTSFLNWPLYLYTMSHRCDTIRM